MWSISVSPQCEHVQPVEEVGNAGEASAGRMSRHASHCRVRGSFMRVQRGHRHWSFDIGSGEPRDTTGDAAPDGGGVVNLALRPLDDDRDDGHSDLDSRDVGRFAGCLTAAWGLTVALCNVAATLTTSPDGSASSRTITSESESPVRSMTSSCILSWAAF